MYSLFIVPVPAEVSSEIYVNKTCRIASVTHRSLRGLTLDCNTWFGPLWAADLAAGFMGGQQSYKRGTNVGSSYDNYTNQQVTQKGCLSQSVIIWTWCLPGRLGCSSLDRSSKSVPVSEAFTCKNTQIQTVKKSAQTWGLGSGSQPALLGDVSRQCELLSLSFYLLWPCG